MDKYPKKTIGELCHIEKGVTGLASAEPGPYPLVATSLERKSCNTYQFDTQAVCIPLVSSTGHGKKTLNYVHYQEGKFALGTILAAVIPKDSGILTAGFLHRYLQFFKETKLVSLMKGAANVSLAVKDIAKIEIPIPPIEEQIQFIELFNKANNFGIQLVGEFNTQSNYLKQLRQSILQEAIEGKLTADWRKTHPVVKGNPDFDAEALLDVVKADASAALSKRSKNDKLMPEVQDSEKPFELPNGWAWCRLGDIIHISSGDGLTSKQMIESGQIPVYGGNGINGLHNKANVFTQTIVIGRVGAQCGSIHLTEENAWVTDNAFITKFNNERINRDWLIKLLIKLNLRINARETAQPVISGKRLYPLLIPLPSLLEQLAIVVRVDNLFAMVDLMEKQVKVRKVMADELMQSVLREAFGR